MSVYVYTVTASGEGGPEPELRTAPESKTAEAKVTGQPPALVLGGDGGIGTAVVEQLVALPPDKRPQLVYATVRREAEIERLMAIPYVTVIPEIDVTKPDCGARIRDAIGPTTKLGMVIAAVGVLSVETLDDMDFGRIMEQFEVNALGPLRIVTALKDNLGSGSKVGFLCPSASSTTLNESGKLYGHRMSKAALNAAAVSLAKDLGPAGVSVGMFDPGLVKTSMVSMFKAEKRPAAEAAVDIVHQLSALTPETSGKFLPADTGVPQDPIPF